ncbi:hypothetical protein H0H87_010663 [Tephrocybe sp. NHM501043]|nr:hypothetical protein H0H87_010663 [Tephrocybe sp. NHM501043]
MKLSTAIFMASALAAYVHSKPVKRSAAVDDVTVLNLALTLENLEAQFYQSGLKQYDEKAFAEAGLKPWVRGLFTQIAEHEGGARQLSHQCLERSGAAAMQI